MAAKPASWRHAFEAKRGPLAALVASVALVLAWAGSAHADFGIVPHSFQANVSTFEAGAHPDATTTFDFNTRPDGSIDGNVRDVQVDLPPGLVGNPQAVPRCDIAFLTLDGVFAGGCPNDTMVGVARLGLVGGTTLQYIDVGVFNVEPAPGAAASFAFNIAGFATVRVDASVASDSDYHLRMRINQISQLLALQSSTLTLWGVPADHNAPGPNALQSVPSSYGSPSNEPRRPFLTNPVDCTTTGAATLTATPWAGGSPQTAGSAPQSVRDCGNLKFDPTIGVQPDNPRAGEPSGYTIDLGIPQSDDPDGLATPPLRDATVDLPTGVAVSPAAADGLAGCTDAQVGIGNADQPTCGDGSKIGTVSITTPLLADPLQGAIYLGQPTSNDAQTGNMLRVFLVAQGSGVMVKLEGHIRPDRDTGQLRATFDDNPQLPFSLLHLHFQDGPRAPLTNPASCGTYTTSTTLTSWGGQVAQPSGSFQITQGPNGNACGAQGFAPSFSAGTTSTAAGKDAPFAMTFAREDTDRTLKDIAVNTPPGLLANISSAVLCPDSAAALGTCEDVSKIGTATTSAGSGTNPLYLKAGPGGKSGSVFITGPHGGAPFGLSIVIPAIAGPFDLGTVVVRAAVFVDKHTAALRIVSDPLPTILQGIPLNIRLVNIDIDRPGFMFNPTSCSATRVGATIGSNGGAAANVSSRFQVGGCGSLPFKPKMTISAGGKGHDSARASTPLKVVLAMPKSNANNKRVDVTLPSSLNAHLQALQHPCSQAAFDTDTCGPLAKVGTASAVTPVLRDPLRGGVFFVTNPKKGALPFMEVQLRGQVAVDLRATIKTTPLVETTFTTIPDVPISKFTLNLVSGKQGPVGARTDLCTATSKATARFVAQNGKTVTASPKVAVAGCRKPRARKSRAKPRGAKARPKAHASEPKHAA